MKTLLLQFCKRCNQETKHIKYNKNSARCQVCFKKDRQRYVNDNREILNQKSRERSTPEYRQKYYQDNKVYIKEYQRDKCLQNKYGITFSDKTNLIQSQNYKCAICQSDLKTLSNNKIHTDHDHVTNKIRGILCNNCNFALGLFKDNITFLQSAINYLKSS